MIISKTFDTIGVTENLSALLVWTVESPLRELFFNPFKIFLKIFFSSSNLCSSLPLLFSSSKASILAWVYSILFLSFCISSLTRRRPAAILSFSRSCFSTSRNRCLFFSDRFIVLCNDLRFLGQEHFGLYLWMITTGPNRLPWKCRTRRPLAQTKPF